MWTHPVDVRKCAVDLAVRSGASGDTIIHQAKAIEKFIIGTPPDNPSAIDSSTESMTSAFREAHPNFGRQLHVQAGVERDPVAEAEEIREALSGPAGRIQPGYAPPGTRFPPVTLEDVLRQINAAIGQLEQIDAVVTKLTHRQDALEQAWRDNGPRPRSFA